MAATVRVEPTATIESSSDHRFGRWTVWAAGAIGAGLLAYLIVRLGPARIVTQLHGLSAILPAVLVLTGCKYPLQAAGWRLALTAEARPPWLISIRSTIAGDAMGYLTWAGQLTAEPTRALLIRGRVPVATSLAAGAAERALYNVTGTVLVWGVLLALAAQAHPLAVASAVAGTVAAIVAMVRLVRAPGGESGSRVHRVEASPATHRRGRMGAGLRRVRDALTHLWATRRRALPVIALLCVGQHVLLVAEAYVMLGAFDPEVTIATAFVFEAVTKLVNTAGMLVPARLGVAEGGSALLADALGFAASHGLSLALMRRVRALIWSGVGLLVLPYGEARGQRLVANDLTGHPDGGEPLPRQRP